MALRAGKPQWPAKGLNTLRFDRGSKRWETSMRDRRAGLAKPYLTK